MYRVGRRNRAHAHGTYIRPIYVDMWLAAKKVADERGASLSEFVNYTMFVMMTGKEPSDSKLTGHTPFSKGRVFKIESRTERDARIRRSALRIAARRR